MYSLTHKQRYLPHELSTRFYAVKLYRSGSPVSFVCRRYKISKSSLMRWNKAFDGTKLSLLDRSHRPHSTHPRAHTQEELLWIKNYFGYTPKILQTDNGLKFCNTVRTDKKHILDIRCEQLGIVHRRIRPRTPRHNGKVERSHCNDQERFYNFLSFYSLDDLKVQIKRYLYRSNRIPMTVLGWLSPMDMRRQLISSGNYVT